MDATDHVAVQPDYAAWSVTRQGLQVYGDSAYGTGGARTAFAAGGHDTVIKPKPQLPAVPGGFTLDLLHHRRAGPHPRVQAGLPHPVERGTDISWVATQRGRRVKLRYHGVDKNHAWRRTRAAW